MSDKKVQIIDFSGRKRPRILFLGTNITPKSYEARFPYSRVNNDFWGLIEYVFDIPNLECAVCKYGKRYDELVLEDESFNIVANDELEASREQIKNLLHSKENIAVGDIFSGFEENGDRVDELDVLIGEADLIIFNGENTLKALKKFNGKLNYDISQKEYIYVRNSSGNALGGKKHYTKEMRKDNRKNKIKAKIKELGYE